MANITLSVSNETQKKMKQFSEIRWSEVARQAINKKIEYLERAEQNTIEYTSQEIKHFFTMAAEEVEEYFPTQSEVVLKDE